MKVYDTIASKIIKEQESIIGPVAWIQAAQVNGLQIVNQVDGDVKISDELDAKSVVNGLVAQYEGLFGKAAQEVCKESVMALLVDLSPTEIPSALQ